MVFEQSEIEEAVLDHFKTIFEGSRVPVFTNTNDVDQVDIALQDIDQILASTTPSFQEDQFESDVVSPYSFSELESILDSLPPRKAAGFDNISNELLKNTNFDSRLYLQTFLNKIISDGEVPPDLNLGKCMLVHKVKHTVSNVQIYIYYLIIPRVEIHVSQVCTDPLLFQVTCCAC